MELDSIGLFETNLLAHYYDIPFVFPEYFRVILKSKSYTLLNEIPIPEGL